MYWESISGFIDKRSLLNIFSLLKDSKTEYILDFLIYSYLLQQNKVENLEILAKTTRLLKGDERLGIGYEVQDNYIREILNNRKHFSPEDKINAIHNACKVSEGTHIIKYGNLFLNTERNGDISDNASKCSGESRALGLFTDDMQYINEYYLDIFDSTGSKLKSNLRTSKDVCYASIDRNSFEQKAFVTRKRVLNYGFLKKLSCKILQKKNSE